MTGWPWWRVAARDLWESGIAAFIVLSTVAIVLGMFGVLALTRGSGDRMRASWLADCAKHRPLAECRADYADMATREVKR